MPTSDLASRLARAALATVLAAGVLAACSSDSGQQADLWIGPTPVIGASGLDAGWSSVEDGLLVTPTLAVQVDRVKRSDGLSAEDCAVLTCTPADGDAGSDADADGDADKDADEDGSHGIAAADGHDLVAVLLRAPLRGAPFAQSPTVPTITIGGHRVEADALTRIQVGSPAGLIASVPEDLESLELRIELDGRAMTLDLLSGERADDDDTRSVSPLLEVAPQPLPRSSHAARGRMQVTGGPTIRFPLTYEWSFRGDLVWSPWTATNGWARPGSAWITLHQVAVGTTLRARDNRRLWLREEYVDMRASWTLVPSDGAPIRPDTAAVEIGGGLGALGTDLTWPVPADTTSGTLRLRTQGDLEIGSRVGSDFGPFHPDWSRAPEPMEVDFDLTEAGSDSSATS